MSSLDDKLAFLKQVESNPENAEKLKQVLKGYRYMVICVSCGTVFLDLPATEFKKLHDWHSADKWYVEACLHYCENPKHNIIGYIPDQPHFNFSRYWQSMSLQLKCSVKALRKYALKLKEKVRDKPL